MRESRTYGSVRGARDETRVPTATVLLAAPAHGSFWPGTAFVTCTDLIAIGGKADAADPHPDRRL